jgi:glyoxylase-like metal-dependent hydrolase (beta-lactamase superfamily II)
MALKAAIIPVTPFQQNCALLWEEATGRGVVIDPGGEVDRIQAALTELKVTAERILLTHGHVDHAAGAAELRDALAAAQGAPVPIEGPDRRDAFLLDGLEEAAAKWDLPARNVTPDRWLAEGGTVEIGGHDFAVLHCPGHTPGHVVFVSEALRIAVVGDVLFRGSIGRTDFAYGDHAALLAAIHGKLLPLGDDIGFLCGHGPGSTFGFERERNPFLRGA